jgi:peptidoglycan/LPS O-acetylase OafA/YrhL
MGWVILGHVFGFRLETSYMENPDNVFDMFKKRGAALAYGGFFAVDTFFWIGGLLMAYLFLKELAARP